MVKVYNKQTDEFLGRLNDEQLKFLADQLEEESSDDNDYYLTRETIDSFANLNPPPGLVEFLQNAIRAQPNLEIRWTRA